MLGVLTMISPCPFCSDITAVSYLGKNVCSTRTLLWNSLFYVLGKCFSYTVLALVFIAGTQIDGVRAFFEHYGEPALGPFLILVGLCIAFFGWREAHHEHRTEEHDEGHCSADTHHEHAPHRLISRLQTVNLRPLSGPVMSFVLGAVFALAFCPYSGVLYFGTLLPLTLLQPPAWSWLMPVLFGLGDALPVLVISLIISKGLAGIGRINGNLMHIELWLRRICVIIFLGLGIYLTVSIFSGHHHHEHHHEHVPVQAVQR